MVNPNQTIQQTEEPDHISVPEPINQSALLVEMARQNEYLAALHDTTVGLMARLDLGELLETLLIRASQLLHVPHGFVFVAQTEEPVLVCKVGIGALDLLVGSRRKPGEGMVGKVWETGEALIVDDYQRWPHRLSTDPPLPLGAIMAMPLKSSEKVIGVIGLAQERGPKQGFAYDEVEVLSRFAQLASVALDNAQLYAATQESQRRMADIIDFLPDATMVIDRDGKVIAWNQAMEEMTGISAADMLGRGHFEYALPFYAERRPILIDQVLLPDEEIRAKYAHMQKRGSILVGEVWVPQLKGAPAYLFATASKLRDSTGETVGAIEVIRDITDRKKVEEELRQAKAAAESATQAKSAFLATMSHEIRTPMNAVIGMTSLLLDTPLTPEQRDFAETIRISGDALLTIINDILDFSKIEAGRMDLECAPFDVRECVEGALELVAPKASEKDLELVFLMEPQVPAAIASDMTRLRQVLVNLLSNAVKFTQTGEVVVTLTTRSDHPLGSSQDAAEDMPITRHWPEQVLPANSAASPVVLHFSVRDTGLGIPADRLDRLFQSFSQVDSSTTRKYGGTGLGLAISKRLVELMGGQMWIESTGIPGQGSTFHFTIQVSTATLADRPAVAGEKADIHGRRVLIVDDNATNRRIFSLQTQGWGMIPRDTSTPAEALSWVMEGELFDIALIDRQMPEMDGLALAAEIKHLLPELPLVLVSSLSQREAGTMTECFAATLLKPVRAGQLYDTLVELLATEEQRVTDHQETTVSEFDTTLGERLPLGILVAEDHVVNQKLVRLMLGRLGYRADIVANGLEVLEALARRPYDVVLMDMQMPEMDGIEATREIRRLWPSPSKPAIIAMTANVTKEDREACFDAGMDDFLSKPIRVEELVAALSRTQTPVEPGPDTRQPTMPVNSREVVTSKTIPPPAAMAELDQTALNMLLALVNGDQDLLGELIDSFLEETPLLITALRRHLDEGNALGVQQAAHPLKSSSRDFGAIHLAELARQLEEMGKAGTLAGAKTLVDQVEVEYPMVTAALQAVRHGELGGGNST